MNRDHVNAELGAERPETVSRRTVVGRVVAGAFVTPVRAAYTFPKIMTLGLVGPATLLASGPVRPPSNSCGGDGEPNPPSTAPPSAEPSSDVRHLPNTEVGIH
jgi:hypothetical protein